MATRATALLTGNFFEEAGRAAYLASFHAAQAIATARRFVAAVEATLEAGAPQP